MARSNAGGKSDITLSRTNSHVSDDKVEITICFCDENCSVYKLIKEKEKEGKSTGWNDRKNETNRSTDLVKRKIVDCRQVRIPASINVLSSNKQSEQYLKVISKYNSNSNQQSRSNQKKTYNGANGLQPPQEQQRQRNSYKQQCTILNSLIQPDITVIVNTTEFKCSGELLKRYSTFFQELEVDDKFVIYLCGICMSEETFSTLYSWMQMYVEEPSRIVNENNIVDVMCACLCLGIKELEAKCWKMICDEALYTGEKSFKIYRRSAERQFEQIESTVFDRVIKYFPVLQNTKGFLEIESEQLIQILSSDKLVVNSEMEIFLAACKWILNDLETRWNQLPDIINCVRFGLMLPEQLCCLHLLDVPDHLKAVATHPHTVRRVEDGLVLNSLKSEFNFPKENTWEFNYKCKELGIESAKERSKGLDLQVCLCHRNK